MPFYTYVLENPGGRFYIGHTADLDRRLNQHNLPLSEGVSYPRKTGPWRVVWSEEHATRAAAMLRERQIKSMKSSRWIREHLLSGS